MRNPYDIIRTARLTEKGTRLTEEHNQYVFEVDTAATKVEIKQAVEAIFKKKVQRVNTLRVLGKARRQRTAAAGSTSNWKKAIVTLKDGERLDLV
ncbi:MAG: 50S ribosomal protein L23 [Candidatus Methylacidiphilales bacterium]|nr:50S ribosomal protein L23 [Candidatus Methylacidiphilales bacterium]